MCNGTCSIHSLIMLWWRINQLISWQKGGLFQMISSISNTCDAGNILILSKIHSEWRKKSITLNKRDLNDVSVKKPTLRYNQHLTFKIIQKEISPTNIRILRIQTHCFQYWHILTPICISDSYQFPLHYFEYHQKDANA